MEKAVLRMILREGARCVGRISLIKSLNTPMLSPSASSSKGRVKSQWVMLKYFAARMWEMVRLEWWFQPVSGPEGAWPPGSLLMPPFVAHSSKQCWQHVKESVLNGALVSESFQGVLDWPCYHRESDQPHQWWMHECGPVLKQRKNDLDPEVLYSWNILGQWWKTR